MGQSVDGILGMAGNTVSSIGAQKTLAAEERAANLNRAIVLREGAREEARIRREGRRQASRNVTRVAKSGVRLEGSPLDVLVDNAGKVEREAIRVRQAKFLSAELLRKRANAIQDAGDLALISSSISGGRQAVKAFDTSGRQQRESFGSTRRVRDFNASSRSGVNSRGGRGLNASVSRNLFGDLGVRAR